MLMYHVYILLSQPFSPCLALAREIVNTFQDPFSAAMPTGMAAASFPLSLPSADVHATGV
ncbi:hypothetical protein B0T39_15850 [Chromobacterium haemolyticum]|nr:hypothetical protein B0T39_15850 [Chromobacterium haemolyticum]